MIIKKIAYDGQSAAEVPALLEAAGEKASVIGRVTDEPGVRII